MVWKFSRLFIFRKVAKYFGWKISRWSGKLLGDLGSFWIVWKGLVWLKVSGWSWKCVGGKFVHGLWSFQRAWGSGKSLNPLESFWIVWKVAGCTGKLLGGLGSFQIVQFLDSPEILKIVWMEIFQMIWKIAGRFWKFLDGLKRFRMVWKVSLWSAKLRGGLKSFQIVWKVAGWYGNF